MENMTKGTRVLEIEMGVQEAKRTNSDSRSQSEPLDVGKEAPEQP